MNERVETPKQLATRVDLTVGKVKSLIRTCQLEHVWIGKRVFIPAGAFSRYLEANTEKMVTPCHDETKARDCGGSKNGDATISAGLSEAAAASAALARQTANKLKLRSPNSSAGETGDLARVIPLKSS